MIIKEDGTMSSKSFVMNGDPGGARTHDPLIKSETVRLESTDYKRQHLPKSAIQAISDSSFDQGFDQVGR